MRRAISTAEVGDDVYGEDPTVNCMESLAAQKLGKEAALLVSSGTQGNLLAILSHCQRGDEYIVGQHAHAYRNEAGGAAVLGSVQPQPLEFKPDGTLDLGQVEAAIKPDDYHYAHTRLLCLENTQDGKVLPLDYLRQARSMADKYQLGLHLDGARLFNAAVKLAVDPREITQYFDTVSVCLSKGLAAPVGSILCGPRALIDVARRWRKMVGGGMRQAGIIAAAGIIALEEMVERLKDDHHNAWRLAEGLSRVPGITVDLDTVQTNMVFFRLDKALADRFGPFMAERNIIIGGGDSPIRAVTHYGINADDIEFVVESAKACSTEFLNGHREM
jgi:threonine aldolase